ncbi:MAG TPA: DUF1127 domain-containing protein [Bradyrhizobium sp.]|nr:DUF1127 domain-containing protein [Bradyrhizobium sp.]
MVRTALDGLEHAQPPGLAIVLARSALSMVRTWRARARFRRELAARSEYELQDMGTCWSSISDEVGKPFWRA